MSEPTIPIARPLFGAEEEAAASRVLRSGWIMQGTEVEAFERELTAITGAPLACAVSSGTAALHLALLAVGVSPGDEVIAPSHSFIATANAIRLCGAIPVFVDVEEETFNLDARLVEAAISPRTRAVLAVHQLGMPADLVELVAICERAGVMLVEDAACAIGAEISIDGRWEKIGRPRGQLACFSFHPRKIITTGEGGAITTRDAALDARVRRLRQHGSDPRGVFVEPGLNYRMTDLQAAVGRVQLGRLPSLLSERREQVENYRARLAAIGLQAPVEPSGRTSNWQSLCVRLPGAFDPARVVNELGQAGIGIRRAVSNAHEQPAYADPASHRTAGPLTQSERLWNHGICLPLYPGMRDEDQARVVDALRIALKNPHVG